ncbi:MAG: PucC family protein [Rhodobacteraceae bacterium]|jgi:BCD family chlorophyll transporter-like MFS transporter|nr:PucC family protein [Paracoccaceae bacterium]
MTLSWFGIFRLGVVQMCLGAVVVLMTSTLNRLMVVELSLPAVLPGFLVALHYGVQISRPNWGFLSDTGASRRRWIVAGMALLGAGAVLAALALPVLAASFWPGLALSVLAYAAIGLGVGASGTSLLALLATATAPQRRAAAATITWAMMIGGIAATAAGVGQLLDPYSHDRLLAIVAAVAAAALALTVLATAGVERRLALPVSVAGRLRFRAGIAAIWAEPRARAFTLFVFLSMTAYFMQELIMEPFAGLVFGLTPGQTTSLSGAQNGGVLVGMLAVGAAATGLGLGSLRGWVVAGCLGSAAALAAVAAIGTAGAAHLLFPAVAVLGVFNGMFAVAAVGAMMALAGDGQARREGTRMGLWGAAQAMAAGFGGLAGAALADLLRRLMGSDAAAFEAVFLAEAALFVAAAAMAARIIGAPAPPGRTGMVPGE